LSEVNVGQTFVRLNRQVEVFGNGLRGDLGARDWTTCIWR
jgi:hypothetical protein